MAIPYTKTSTSLTLVVGFRPTVIPASHPNFAELARLAALPETTEADIKPLLDIPAAISAYTGGDVVVTDGRLFYRGVEVKDNLAQIILGFVKSGQPDAAEPFKQFMANCRNNPDLRLVDTIYDWVVKANMPITPDGCLLAWKIVSNDYMSLTSGKRGRLRHQVGDVVTEPREECDPNRNRTCSTGIHFASIEYLEKGSYGGGIGGGNKIVAVKINPADITAIPTDYNLSKGRCCKLEVVGEVRNEPDTVNNFYRDSGKVYSGWTPKARRTRFPIQNGDVWKTEDGRDVRVVMAPGNEVALLSSKTGDHVGFVFADDGTAHRDEKVARERGCSLVELLEEGKELAQQLDLRAGDVVVTRSGQTVTVTGVGEIVRTTDSVWADCGLCQRHSVGSTVTRTNPQDAVRVISRAPRIERNAHGFAVGQVWADGQGTEETITSISAGGSYPIETDAGQRYTALGRFNSNTNVSEGDLKRLIKDVA